MKNETVLWKPLRWALAASAAVLLSTGVASARDDEQVLTLPLGGTAAEPLANGTATYRIRPDQTKLEIEIEDLHQTASVEFFLDGASLGSAAVSLGEANLELESETASVPVLSEDSEVVLRDASSGDIVATSGNVASTEGDDEGFDDNGGTEGDDEGFDDNGGTEGDDEGFDDNGGNEGDDEGFDDNGDNEGDDNSEGEDEGDNEGDDNSEGEDEGDDDSGEVELEFALDGTSNDPNAYGKAELKNDNDRRRIEVEVQGVTAATRVSVLVDGVNVGTGSVREGEAEVKRDEREDYTIPVVSAASRVDVINSDNGDILLSNKEVVIAPEGETEGSSSEGEGEGALEGEGEPSSDDGIQLRQKLGPNGYYVPGETTVIEARMTYTGAVPVLALSIEQTLPEGWTYVGTLNGMGAFLNPAPGDSGTLTWAWINVPAMPATLRYEVLVPEDATGVQTVAGNVLYRRMGGAEYAVSKLDAPAGEGFPAEFCHSTDTDDSWTVELSEVLRMIQIHNVGAYHCSDGTEDGYAPGIGDDSCMRHDSDQLNPDWAVDVSELLRTIQFYNSEDSAYQVVEGTEDGFEPGVFRLED
jgi:hypothetical protein